MCGYVVFRRKNSDNALTLANMLASYVVVVSLTTMITVPAATELLSVTNHIDDYSTLLQAQ